MKKKKFEFNFLSSEVDDSIKFVIDQKPTLAQKIFSKILMFIKYIKL